MAENINDKLAKLGEQIVEAAQGADFQAVDRLVTERRRLEKEIHKAEEAAQAAVRQEFTDTVAKLAASVPRPKGSTLVATLKPSDDGSWNDVNAVISYPDAIERVASVLTPDVLANAPSTVKRVRVTVTDKGADVELGGRGATGRRSSGSGNGNGHAQSLTVNGHEHPSAMAAYRAVLGEPKHPMNRASVISALKAKGHSVS